jgi:hypothetical protein
VSHVATTIAASPPLQFKANEEMRPVSTVEDGAVAATEGPYPVIDGDGGGDAGGPANIAKRGSPSCGRGRDPDAGSSAFMCETDVVTVWPMAHVPNIASLGNESIFNYIREMRARIAPQLRAGGLHDYRRFEP